MNAWNGSSSCEISDQGGSATSSNCQVAGYACSAKLGYPPGRTEGEMSPVVSCAEAGKPTLSFIRAI
jgi:hypothetical protein